MNEAHQGVSRCKNPIRTHQELSPSTERRAIHGRDDQLRKLAQAIQGRTHVLRHLLGKRRIQQVLPNRDQIPARAEGTPSLSSNQDQRSAPALELSDRIAQISHHPWRDRISPLGMIDDQLSNVLTTDEPNPSRSPWQGQEIDSHSPPTEAANS
jgi:hypothetical protein